MVLNTKLVVPIALGFSIVTVTAFVVYYVFKKDEENETHDKSTIKTSRVNVIEVSVPKSIVPALIGRNGSNIKEIEKKSGALMHFKKFSDKDYDVCIIRGRTEASQLAETLIHEFIKNQPVIEEGTVCVPNWACGRIIGTGGENINDMSHRSGAKLKIESNQTSTEDSTTRMISIKGTKEQIQTAKGLIDKCVAQEKCRREIEQSKRTPRYVQPVNDSTIEMPGEQPTHKHAASKRSEVAGAAIEVYVSAVSSPSRFWVQFVGPQVAQLDELVQHMTEYYSNKDNREAHALSSVSVGQVVAAVFRHDGRWYRARVADIKPNEFDASQRVADVFFVDYGDSEYVATHELCELRADLLRLRFQAMECFLAGVRPAGDENEVVGVTVAGQRWDKWHPTAIERFEELTQVARWKSLVSKTCSYKRSASGIDGEKEREIPGIKLYDVTEDGEIDVGGVLMSEGWAVPAGESRTSTPVSHVPPTPFGDLGSSKVLFTGSGGGGERAASLPKDHEHPSTPKAHLTEEDRKLMSTSLASGLEKSEKPTSSKLMEMTYPDLSNVGPKTQVNGSHESFLNEERRQIDGAEADAAVSRSLKDALKANINRIDSHHGNLETLDRQRD
ncbi:Tudor and KH domain-containing protein homolog [Eumeta japonica]|uniref:Tudor and KH domain-containing protein homolog n=1 Tax=Eumeta variegata TaxID=151549 RepID=A0A4C1T7Z8_EUMVA|nr:Tudor and KH domain-containing protein homolog [Eumeta japonica]